MRRPTAIFLVICSILVWCLYGSANLEIASWIAKRGDLTIEQVGQWGDSFGAFTALFTTLGTFGVVWTLILQQNGLKAQAQDIHKQRFEATFFELIRLMKEARRGLRFSYSTDYIKGKGPILPPPAIQKWKEPVFDLDAIVRARAELEWWITRLPKPDKRDREKVAQLFVEKVFERYPGRYGAYYRLVYSIMKRIRDDKVLNEDEKKDYARLFRAQFTLDEVVLLAFNGLSGMSGDLNELIVELRMLKYIDHNNWSQFVKRFYPSSAFAPRD